MDDYVDVPILAASLSKRARGYTSLGLPDPRGLTPGSPGRRGMDPAGSGSAPCVTSREQTGAVPRVCRRT